MALTCGYRERSSTRKDLPRMATNGHHAPPDTGRKRRALLIIGAVVLAILVYGGGYALGRGNDTPGAASSVVPSASVTHTRSPEPKPAETGTPTPSASASETPSPDATAEPESDTLPDGQYFVRLNDLEGGEAGPPAVRYDLAYFLTGAEADQAAKDRGLESPVPDGYFIVNDSHRMRVVPLADRFGVKYIPEGTSQLVKAHNAAFLGWLGETQQSDFPPKETSWWWITIEGGEITTVKQQFLP